MGFISEFKKFAARGNMIDLAVGVIIGAAFGRVVDSIVKDLIMPLIAAIFDAPDFSNAYIAFGDVPKGTPLAKAQEIAPVFAYGNFLTVVLNFVIIALAVFMLVKAINKLKEEPPPAPAVPSTTDQLLMEIRDNLKK